MFPKFKDGPFNLVVADVHNMFNVDPCDMFSPCDVEYEVRDLYIFFYVRFFLCSAYLGKNSKNI